MGCSPVLRLGLKRYGRTVALIPVNVLTRQSSGPALALTYVNAT
jgi:hypothetical protein